VRYTQVLGHERVLGSHIVVECDLGERLDGRVRGGGGLAVAEEGGDYDVVFLGVEDLVLPDQPLVVGDCWSVLI